MKHPFVGSWIYFLSLFLVILGFLLIFLEAKIRRWNLRGCLRIDRVQLLFMVILVCKVSLEDSLMFLLEIIRLSFRFIVQNGEKSWNSVRLAALPSNPKISDAIELISEVNNFYLKFSKTNQNQYYVESLGDIKNDSRFKWKVFVNDKEVYEPLNAFSIGPDDVIIFRYE